MFFQDVQDQIMMAAKVGKKGNKTVDVWLDKIGLYRKNIAYDETCLFRAISEQLYNTQIHHEKIRAECVHYAREYYEKFVDNFFSTKEDFFDHIERLEKHMVNCGDIELKIISEKYSRCIVIYDAKTNQEIYPFYNKNHIELFSLCLMDGDHYDVVYQKDHIVTAGFCQSIIYKILYENVFHIPDVDETVHNMLYDKGNIITQAELMMEKKKKLCESENESVTDEKLVEEKINSSLIVAPFPYKIAKALDPNIYRNIEYDSWSELRREFRLGEWYNGDERLILGTKCIYHDEKTNRNYDCYIQEFVKEGDKCMVYLTTTAEKRIVDYCTLSPEDDAKPWPLPFRFKKSVAICPDSRPLEKNIPRLKKKKEKKRTKSESNILYTATSKPEQGLKNVDAYVGVPLQIQNVNSCEENADTSTEPQLNSESLQPDGAATTEIEPNSYWYNSDYQWQPYVQQPSSPFLWINNPPNTNQNLFNFNLKPMVASAPVTPSIIPYHDPNFFYNHPVESYQAYPQWSTPAFELLPPRNRQENMVKQEVTSEDAEISQQDAGRNAQENLEGSEFYCRKNKKKLNVPILPTIEIPNYDPGRLEMYTPVTPPYPQMTPTYPSTPVVFTPVPPAMTEMMMPSSPATFIPSLEMPYMPSSPLVYPLSPPLTTWYPYTGMAPQEFVFPPKP